MAYEIYDLKGILFLVFAIPMIASISIDCSGKAFHCVNSTHFMICVDLGGGISTTIDDFVIPCPPTTVCHEHNIFECEFPNTLVTIPPLQVIGVSKQSDLSITTSVIYSVTVPTPPEKSLIVLNENTTMTTVPIPEEVISVKNSDVLENFKQRNENSMDTSANSETVNVKQTNNITNKKTSTIDKNIILDLDLQTSIDKAVTATDNSKSTDMMTSATSIIKLIKIISDDSQSLASPRNISYNNTDIKKNVDDVMSITVNTFIWNGPDGMSRNSKERNSIGEISTTEKDVYKKNGFTAEPSEEVLIDQITTQKNFATLAFGDLFFDNNVASPTTTSDILTFLNISHNTTDTAEQYTATQAIINDETVQNISGIKSDVLSEISTTTVANTNHQNKENVNNQNELVYQIFVEQTSTVEVTETEPERITKYIYPDEIENSVSAPEIVMTSPQTTTNTILENIIYTTTARNNNDSFVEDVTDAHPIEIYTTDLTVKLTNNSYQMNRELSKAFIATNNNPSGTNDTIATMQSVYNISSTNMFNDITTELNALLTARDTETSTPPHEAKANGKGVENEISSITIAPSVNNTTLNIYATPVPYNATFNSVTYNTVKDRISQIDIYPNASYIIDIIEPETSEKDTFLDRSTTTENADVVETVFSQENLNIYQVNRTPQDENVNKTNTDYQHDVSKQDINPIKINNNQSHPPTTPSIYAKELTTNTPGKFYTTTISTDYVSKVPKYNPVITDKSLFSMDITVETSTSVPLDYTIIGEQKKIKNMLTTTMPAREAITQEVDTHKEINTNRVSTNILTDIFSSISKMYAQDYDFTSNSKDSEYIETTTSTSVKQNKTDNKSGINSINVKNSDGTTLLPPTTNTYKDESVKIMSLMEMTTSSINLLSNERLKPSNSDITSILNSTKTNVTNTSLSDGYIGTKKEKSSFNTTSADNNSGQFNRFKQIAKSQSASESLQKNTQASESLPQKNNMNLEFSLTNIQTSRITEKNTENGESVTNTDSPLRNVGFNQRYPTTNSMNYGTEKIMDFASSNDVMSIKQSNPPNVETKPAIPVSDPTLDTITKTTAFVQSRTHIVQRQGINNNFEERKELPVIEIPTDNYNKIKPLQKTYTITPVISAPITMMYSNTSKIKTSNLSLSQIPTASYNLTTESVKSDVTAPSSMMNTSKGIGEKIIEVNNAKVSFSEVTFHNQTIIDPNLDDKSVNNVIDHEKILMENNTFQDNIQNITNIIKKIVDINKENVNNTENYWMPSDINIEIGQKIANNINGSLFEEEVTSESMISKSTDIQNKSVPTSSVLPIQSDNKDLKQPDFVKYKLPVITSPLYAIEIEAYTEVPYINQDEFETDSQNISIKFVNSKANLTTPYSYVPLQKNIVNGSLEEHLNSTNHTITTEIQRYFNTSDKQRNEPVSSGDIMRNSNITIGSIKLNADNKYNTTTNDSASYFNCLNQTRGKYADKKDCRKFYTCVGKLQPIIGACPNNTVFSEINKQCTRNLSHCVRNNQFRCLLEGRFGDFFLDNIYYICVKNSMNAFVRYKLQCQNGYHINKVSVKCEKNDDIQSQSTSSASENSKINDDDSKPKIIRDEIRKINSTTDFECNSEGKFPYEKDCRKYYVCTNVKNIYRRKIKECASDEIFDNSKKKCIESESSEC